MALMARLNRTWRWNTISFANKFTHYESLVISIFLYGCETCTLLADSEKRIQAFRNHVHEETSPYLDLEHKTNDWVRSKVNFFVVP